MGVRADRLVWKLMCNGKFDVYSIDEVLRVSLQAVFPWKAYGEPKFPRRLLLKKYNSSELVLYV